MKSPHVVILPVTLVFALASLNCGGGPTARAASQSPLLPAGSPSNAGNNSSGSGTSGSSNGSSSSSGGSGTNSGSGSSSSNGNSGSSNSGSSGSGSSNSTNSPNASSKTTIWNVHQQSGWTGYGLLPPGYAICSSCVAGGPQVTWSMQQGATSPSLSGNSTEFNIGGQTLYSDVLWNNHLVGDFAAPGMEDEAKKIVPSVHNFTYEVSFFVPAIWKSQALEFDINQFVDGKSFIWGHECRIAGGNEWDIWNDQAQAWKPTGIACNPVSNSWNNLVIQVQRTSDDQLLFQSITLNGQTATLNYQESPTATNWYGITINYQQDGNALQEPYSVWLDWMNFSYW